MPSRRTMRSLLLGSALFEDPVRSTTLLTRALMTGAGVMAAIGVIDVLNDPSVETAYLPIAASLIVLWCWIRLRRAKPDLLPVLNGAVVLAVGFQALAFGAGATTELTSSATIVIITAVGILALNLPGRRRVLEVAFHLSAVGVAVLLVQMAVNPSPLEVAIDVVVSVLAVGTVFFLVASSRRALEASQSRYRGLVATAPAAVLELDLDGVSDLLGRGLAHEDGRLLDGVSVIEANTAAEGLIDGAGRPRLGDRLDDESRATAARLFAHMVDKPVGEDTVALRIGGEDHHLQVLWSTQQSGRVTVVSVDVTGRVRAEEALSEQLRARDRFIAAVSHELRTPLTAVLGLVEEISDETRPISAPERVELLRLARDQARDVSDIVHDLLVAARAEIGGLVIRPEDVELRSLLGEVAKSFPELPVDIQGPLLVRADPLRLRQILRNLVSNAFRHGGDHRRMSVTCGGGVVVVEVRDSGLPLPEAERERIFDPYYRTSEWVGTPESVGIGLSVARRLARLMGGEVSYHHDGQESIFSLSLPASPPHPQPQPGKQVHAAA